MRDKIQEKLIQNSSQIEEWLHKQELSCCVPFYSSVDVRNGGFKAAVVDTNLFPAGFNNILITPQVVQALQTAIKNRVPNAKNILFITEEHTRNKWYLENALVLQNLMEKAGFTVTVASFLDPKNAVCDNEDTPFIDLETETGKHIRLNCLHRILKDVEKDEKQFDLIILNNDLSTGIPEILQKASIPIYPSLQAGWHSRLKSHHFKVANALISDFAKLIDIDPWLLSCLFESTDHIDINSEEDRQKVFEQTDRLLKEIQKKYDQHHIEEKPFVFLKSDNGTYGMGIHVIENAEDLLTLNRKERNKLHVGKGSQVIERYILQEGVPSIVRIEEKTGEACIYQIANQFMGGFYRINSQKTDRQNLNSQGVIFTQITDDPELELYKILARISGLAAKREICELEQSKLPQKQKSACL